MNYKIKLQNIISKKSSNLVVGIDPERSKLPEFITKYKNPVYEFCKYITEITSDLVAGYKFNLAFFESEGFVGIKMLEKLLYNKIKDTIYICDAKRGDIGNTSEQYAKAYFDRMDFDSMTLSPYMGVDSAIPFLKRKDKFVYILALTSNKGSSDFQKLKFKGKYLYEIIIEKFLKSGYLNIGFVMGAGFFKEIKTITSLKEKIPLLIPGIGTQGFDLTKLIKNLKNNYFLINSSRYILYSGHPNDNKQVYTEKVRTICRNLNYSINSLKEI